MEYVTLNNGVKMPMEGFGVFQVPDPEICKKAVLDALHTGYRLIDTAAAYGNEEAVGQAIKESGIDRSEIFLTTKLWVSDMSYEGAKAGIERCLRKLDTDYIDLLLIHQPMGDIFGAWRAMEEAYKAGKVRAIGVSNFYPERLADFCLTVNTQPEVDQVELHPFFQQNKALETMKKYHVQPEAWGPFAEGKFGIFTNPVLEEIAKAHGKTVGQVILRWNIQRGVVVIPKSVHTARIEENFEIWDFELSDEEMQKISTLDTGRSEIVDHSDPAFTELLHAMKISD